MKRTITVVIVMFLGHLLCDVMQVWTSLLLYRNILDSIEQNNYDNLTKRAYVGRTKKLLMLPLAFARATNMSTIVV